MKKSFKICLFWTVFGFLILPIQAEVNFSLLLHYPTNYRVFTESSHVIADGELSELLYAWKVQVPVGNNEIVWVGIDTLWELPQDQAGDTGIGDWDLQVCPDGFCISGLKRGEVCDCEKSGSAGCPEGFCLEGGVKQSGFGGQSPTSLSKAGEAEHHFQYFQGMDPETFRAVAPPFSLFGGFLFVRSESSQEADTVFGFGAWNLTWDSANPPPLKPNGYLPKKSDFVIEGNMVRYQKGAGFDHSQFAAIVNFSGKIRQIEKGFSISPNPFQDRLLIHPVAITNGVIRVFDVSGGLVWFSVIRSGGNIAWRGKNHLGRVMPPGTYILEITNSETATSMPVQKLK